MRELEHLPQIYTKHGIAIVHITTNLSSSTRCMPLDIPCKSHVPISYITIVSLPVCKKGFCRGCIELTRIEIPKEKGVSKYDEDTQMERRDR